MAGDSIQRQFDGGNSFVNANGESAGTQNVCFAAGTLIATTHGEVAVEQLRAGNRLITKDKGITTLRWLGAQQIDHARLLADPKLWPIEIAANALGAGRPARALRVSPQHRILVSGPIARRMFGEDEVLVPALGLVGLQGVTQDEPMGGVTYLHLMCANHQVIVANGAYAETLYLGRMARDALGRAAVAEILTLLPMLALQPKPARALIAATRTRQLARRHASNRIALQPPAALP